MKKLDIKLIEGKKVYNGILTIKESSFLITTEDSYMVKVLYNNIKDYQVDRNKLTISMNNNGKINLESDSISEVIKVLKIKQTSTQPNKNVGIKGNNNNSNDSYTEQVDNISNNQVMNTGNNKIIAVLISILPLVTAFVFCMLLLNSDSSSGDIGDKEKMRKCIQTLERDYYSTHFDCNYINDSETENYKAFYSCDLNDSKKEVGHAYWSFNYIIAIHKDGTYVIAIKSPTTGEITPIGADCGNN